MSCDPHWTSYTTAFVVPLVAVFGSIIAYRQWRTAQNKLKMELFEKRLEVYEATRRFVASISSSGKVAESESLKFVAGTRSAKWLFDEDLANYLWEEIYCRSIDLQTLDAELEGIPVGEERSKNVRKQAEVKKWFMKSVPELDAKFTSFLKLGH